MLTLLLSIAGIKAFLIAYDCWAEYQGHKDKMQDRKDHFETYGKHLKRKN